MMYLHGPVEICLLTAILGFAACQIQQQLLNKLVCIEHEQCGECLAAAAHCRWCADPYLTSAAPRCNTGDSLVAAGCGQGMIQRPEKSLWHVEEDRPLEDVRPSRQEPVVQIRPQKIHLSLKPRETKIVKFAYRPARNYPLDLYYLMDLTWSMKDDKETLVSLRDDLPIMLKNLTDNFRLGFGSFAEKPLMPYISMDGRRRANPCTVEEEACQPTYSYRHHLSLTNEVSEFIEKVNGSAVTANLDNAEAQLDALVQALSCGSRVGWSSHSRKVVLLLSDGLMHTAGDGKLGGAIRKNDETCHLNQDGYYYQSEIYDYPSVAQLYRLLDKHKVNVIFAVTANVKEHYDRLHELLSDFTYVALLESDSSNILKLVKMGYEDIVSVVNFEDNSMEGPVRVKYFTDCGVKGGSYVETTKCTGVEYGMVLNYEAHISLDSCPEYKKSYHKIRISESQLGEDTLEVSVDVQCGCECESDAEMALTCPANSHLVCGVCQCNKGWSGPMCNCSVGDESASAALVAQCRSAAGAPLCSGAGECVCGRCECDAGRSGRYCQCKPCDVSSENGMECGGAARGVCACGACACAAGWTGAACDCPEALDTCIAPGSRDGLVCSAHGECVCGSCKCASTGGETGTKYSGVYCETCPTCENLLCAHAEPCLLCHLDANCTRHCLLGTTNYTFTEGYDPDNLKGSENLCVFRREENGLECEYKYSYSASDQGADAMEIVLRSKQCSTTARAQIIYTALATVCCVVAGGLAVVLCIKCGQMIADKKAYEKFVEEAQESRKHMQELNPLYISPISEFKIPESFPRERHF